MDILRNLFKVKITWQKDSQNAGKYISIHDGMTFYLTLNDFPDEVMFTVSSNEESIDFDDLPKKWSLEGM